MGGWVGSTVWCYILRYELINENGFDSMYKQLIVRETAVLRTRCIYTNSQAVFDLPYLLDHTTPSNLYGWPFGS